MKKFLPLLPRIAFIGLFSIMVLITFTIAYVFFAPDTWPKPFYFISPETTAGEGEGGGESATPTPEAPVEEPPSVALKLKPGQGIMLDTGSKIVNLQDPTGRKYLRAGIVLEFAPNDIKYYSMEGEAKKVFVEKFNEELNAKLPIINDVLITLLSSQTFENVYSAEGKEKLRKTMIEEINTQLPENQVIFLYFTEFVVQ